MLSSTDLLYCLFSVLLCSISAAALSHGSSICGVTSSMYGNVAERQIYMNKAKSDSNDRAEANNRTLCTCRWEVLCYRSECTLNKEDTCIRNISHHCTAGEYHLAQLTHSLTKSHFRIRQTLPQCYEKQTKLKTTMTPATVIHIDPVEKPT